MKFLPKFSTLAVAGIFFALSFIFAQADQVTAGSNVTLSVTSDGTAPFTYQWIKDGSTLSGSTASTLTITNIQSSNAGNYSVTVTNAAGSTTSPINTITIAVPPAITTQPQSQSVNAGASVTFAATASGVPAPTFQWNRNGVAISGATGATLTLPAVQASDAASYTVVATNSASSVTSAGAVLTVAVTGTTTAPAIVTQPVSQSVTAGTNVTFTVVASGSPQPTYQWKKNGVAISGATSATLTLSAVQTSASATYTAVATNSAGSVTSAGAVLSVSASQATVSNAISYNTTTFPVSVATGATVDFSYNVTNTGTKAWGANHYLSLRDAQNNYLDFQLLSGISPGGSAMVNLSFIAPTVAGTYTYYVQALENGVQMFSTQATLTLTVTGSSPNAISYNTSTFPTTISPGAAVHFSYNVTNTGTKAWGANHYLSLRDGNSNYLDFVSLSGVAPGASTTVNLDFTAPTAVGTYTYYVQALENGVQMFSTQSTLTLTVRGSSPNAINYNTTAFPSAVAAGARVNFSYSVTNKGTKTWGANHYLSLRDANNNYLDFAALSGVAPGGSTTVNLSFTAPTTTGTYIYYVQALENGVELFSTQATLTLTVAGSSPNAISYNTTAFPATVAVGAPINFSYNVTNMGTKAWGANHYLSLRDGNNNYVGFASLNGIASGGSTTVSLNFTAPMVAGTYTYYVQALENGVQMFSTQATLTLTVTASF